jgi:hypothetical protein
MTRLTGLRIVGGDRMQAERRGFEVIRRWLGLVVFDTGLTHVFQ